jgi:hypothetical protein
MIDGLALGRSCSERAPEILKHAHDDWLFVGL